MIFFSEKRIWCFKIYCIFGLVPRFSPTITVFFSKLEAGRSFWVKLAPSPCDFMPQWVLFCLLCFTDHRPHVPERGVLERRQSTSEVHAENAPVEYFFASDASAVIEHTNRVMYLQVYTPFYSDFFSIVLFEEGGGLGVEIIFRKTCDCSDHNLCYRISQFQYFG